MPYTLLYEFSLGDKIWRYTANAEDVIDPSSNVWEAAAISSDGVSTSGSATADALSISASIDIIPARLWMHARPSKVMDVRILRALLPDRVSRGDDEGVVNTSDPRVIPVTELRVEYVGEIAQASFGAPGTAQFMCETISATMQREGLILVWQRSCPYVVYDPLTCRVDKASFGVSRSITGISGRIVTLNAPLPDSRFTGGIIEYEHPLKGESMLTIEGASDSTVAIFEGVKDLYVGQPVMVYPGCDQSPASCSSFGNKLNYGGIEALPGKSPFNGLDGPVF